MPTAEQPDPSVITNAPPAVPPRLPPAPQSTQADIILAQTTLRPIRRAAKYALVDAWTIALFAAPSFICGLFSGVSGTLLGAAMVVIAWFEFTGAARLRRLDPTAPRLLGYNQLALAGVLILYALWCLHAGGGASGLNQALAQYQDQLGDLGPQTDQIMRLCSLALYGGLIAIAVLGQGGTALYYFSRQKHLQNCLDTLPAWIVEMHRAGTPL